MCNFGALRAKEMLRLGLKANTGGPGAACQPGKREVAGVTTLQQWRDNHHTPSCHVKERWDVMLSFIPSSRNYWVRE